MELTAEACPHAHAVCAVPPAERWFASHELRTSLQAIRGGLELLLAGSARGLSAAQLEAVSLIAGAATDLEHHGDTLAELWQLIESPAPQAQPVELRRLLALPPVAQLIRPQPGLVAAWDGLAVRLHLEVAALAFEQLGQLAGNNQTMPLDLIAVGQRDVALRLVVPPPSAGDRAIAWRLAQEFCRHAGFCRVSVSGAGCVLTLKRVVAATVPD